MALYNLTVSDNIMRFQPNLGYYSKIIIFLGLIGVCFVIVPFLSIGFDVKRFAYFIGGGLSCYVIYDFLFVVKVTMIFDRNTRTVYKKIPGIYTKRLMGFEEVKLVNDTSYGTLTYHIGAKSNYFVKNYAISDTFPNNKKGQQRQEEFETTILDPLMEFIK